MLSQREQRQWQELTGQLARDRRLVELAAAMSPADDSQRAVQPGRRRSGGWVLPALLAAVGLTFAVLGSRDYLDLPVLGIGGLLLLLVGYLLLATWFARHTRRTRRPQHGHRDVQRP